MISMVETEQSGPASPASRESVGRSSGHAAHHGSELQDNRGRNSMFVQEATASYATSPPLTIVPFGQILRTYVIAQVGQELQVIDQHTAHERVLFQRLWRAWMKREMVTQPLLIPEPIELTLSQRMLLQKHVGDLEQLGLVLEPFGATAMLLRGVPLGLGPIKVLCLYRICSRTLQNGKVPRRWRHGHNLFWLCSHARVRCRRDGPWLCRRSNGSFLTGWKKG